MNFKQILFVAGVNLLFGGLASTQTYTDLTFTSLGISPDGSTIVARADNGNGFEAVSYDVATGVLTSLGEHSATCASFDGSTLGGEIEATGYGGYYQSGSWTSLGTLNTSGMTCGGSSVPTAISDDGTRLVQSDYPNVCTLFATYYDLPSGPLTTLPKLGTGSTRADSISGDGRTIGGYERFTGTSNQAAIWQFNDVAGDFDPPMLVTMGMDFGDGNLDGLGVVKVISRDGSSAAIEAGLNSAPNVKLWRSDGSVQDLGPIPGFPPIIATPTGMSADGTMIVGSTFGFFDPKVGFVWTESNGMETADAFLARLGVPVPAGFSAAGVTSLSADGKTMVGYSGAFPFTNYWVVTLPSWWKFAEGTAGNTLDLDGGGTTSLGGTFTVTTSNAGVATSAITAVSLGLANAPVFGGSLLIDPNLLQPPLMSYALSGGTGSGSFPVPSDPSIVGRTFYMQSAANNGSFMLSNGLRGVICP